MSGRGPAVDRPSPAPARDLPTRRLPPAAAVLRRALFVWGLGHLAIGDRRGWLLVIVQPVAIVGVVVFAALLLDGTRWMLVFPALLVLLAVWFAQALSAHRRAVELGATPGGELQIALLLPLAVAVVTTFWLVGGGRGSPATALREYVAAWEDGRAETAARLFVAPRDPAELAATWAAQRAYIDRRVGDAAARYGATSGIDPQQPFNSLRFTELPAASSEAAVVEVEIIRRQRVETVLLGFIPTATQETVVVERLGTISLRALPADPPAWLSWLRTGARLWRVEAVDLASAVGGAIGVARGHRIHGSLVDNVIVKD